MTKYSFLDIIGTLRDLSTLGTAVLANQVADANFVQNDKPLKQSELNQRFNNSIEQISGLQNKVSGLESSVEDIQEDLSQLENKKEKCLGLFENSDQLPDNATNGDWAIIPGEQNWIIWLYNGQQWTESEITYTPPSVDLTNYLLKDLADQLYAKKTSLSDYVQNVNLISTLQNYWSKTDLNILNYLTKSDASNTYLNQTDASNIYLRKTDAVNTYLTKSDAVSTYLNKDQLDVNIADSQNAVRNSAIYNEFNSIKDRLYQVETKSKGKGFFSSLRKLIDAIPNPSVGDMAYIKDANDGQYYIWLYEGTSGDNSGWVNTQEVYYPEELPFAEYVKRGEQFQEELRLNAEMVNGWIETYFNNHISPYVTTRQLETYVQNQISLAYSDLSGEISRLQTGLLNTQTQIEDSIINAIQDLNLDQRFSDAELNVLDSAKAYTDQKIRDIVVNPSVEFDWHNIPALDDQNFDDTKGLVSKAVYDQIVTFLEAYNTDYEEVLTKFNQIKQFVESLEVDDLAATLASISVDVEELKSQNLNTRISTLQSEINNIKTQLTSITRSLSDCVQRGLDNSSRIERLEQKTRYKIQLITKDYYERLDEYDKDTVYFVIKNQGNWTFGNKFPIRFGFSGFGSVFPIYLT